MKEEEFSEKAGFNAAMPPSSVLTDVYAFGIIGWELLTRYHVCRESFFSFGHTIVLLLTVTAERISRTATLYRCQPPFQFRKHPFEEFEFKMTFQLEDAIKSGTRPSLPSQCEHPQVLPLLLWMLTYLST